MGQFSRPSALTQTRGPGRHLVLETIQGHPTVGTRKVARVDFDLLTHQNKHMLRSSRQHRHDDDGDDDDDSRIVTSVVAQRNHLRAWRHDGMTAAVAQRNPQGRVRRDWATMTASVALITVHAIFIRSCFALRFRLNSLERMLPRGRTCKSCL